MKAIVTGVIAVVLLGAGGWYGYQYAVKASDARYEALTKAATAALDKGDMRAGARLATAATTGRTFLHRDTSLAEGLLLEAVMKDQPILIAVGTRAFPKFTPTGDVTPENATLSPDGERLMILRNDVKPARQEIYDLSSGRALRQYEIDYSKAGPHIIGFSTDLNTAILLDGETYRFEDVDSGKPVLTDLDVPKGANGWSISRDRQHVAAQNYATNTIHVWDFGVTPTKTRIIDRKDFSPYDMKSAPDYARLIVARGDLQVEGLSDLAIGPSGQYMAESWDDGAKTPCRTRVCIIKLGYHVPLVAAVGSETVFAVLAEDDRFLPLQMLNDLRLFDVRTRRFVGAPSRELGTFDRVMARKHSDFYSIGFEHVLTTARLDPVLTAKLPSLIRVACGKWRATSDLHLTPDEMKTYGLKLAVDPCA